MSAGDIALEEMIAKLRKLPEMPTKAAPEVADACRTILERHILAGFDPYGSQWKLTEEGRKPLPTAGSHLLISSVGPRVFIALKDHVARHNNGTARGGIKRQVIPDKGVPRDMSRAIGSTLSEFFRLTVGA